MRYLLMICILGLVIASCSQQPAPTPTPTVQPTPIVTPTPSETDTGVDDIDTIIKDIDGEDYDALEDDLDELGKI